MVLKLTRGLCIWAGALALVLVCLFLPLESRLRFLTAGLVVLLVAGAWVLTGRKAARQQQSLGLLADQALPESSYRQPVLLVCGDGLSALFGANGDVRTTEQGCYLRVPAVEQLPAFVDALLAHREHWLQQLSVLHVVNASEESDNAVLAGRLRSFRHQLAVVRRRGVRLPLLLVSYLPTPAAAGTWFSWEPGQRCLAARESGTPLDLALWQKGAHDFAGRANRAQACIQLSSAASWLARDVLPHLQSKDQRDPPCTSAGYAIAMVPAIPAAQPGNLWLQWLRERTGLHTQANEPAEYAQGSLPFPDALLHLLPKQTEHIPGRRAGVAALWLFALATAIALASSAWQNLLLLRQVSDDLRRFHAIPQAEHRGQPEYQQQELAMAVLRTDAARLDQYYRLGEPLRLGLGLYRGERLRTPLLSTIASYRQPPLPPEPKIPDPVRLDSLSLFASGSAQLKPGSEKVLINALVDIKAQPGWLIVIAGHTDSTGDDGRNLKLSRDRAAAVRDWMQAMGDIPDSCFAVQGFGARQPIGDNDTPDGRAANRRVDIRLVPEVGACVLPTQAAGGPQRSLQQQATSIP
ncbi:OmpA family protein [Pseudomonas knackmussii]|uniref:OmpA family protein n=1 Tax=Pseudomonas knackmussii TaxID=65741 RepID=UPI003BEE3CD6